MTRSPHERDAQLRYLGALLVLGAALCVALAVVARCA